MSSSHANRDAVARKVNVASALNIAVMGSYFEKSCFAILIDGNSCQGTCDALAECGKYAAEEKFQCPLNVCCR
jgi:hypothetical protein